MTNMLLKLVLFLWVCVSLMSPSVVCSCRGSGYVLSHELYLWLCLSFGLLWCFPVFYWFPRLEHGRSAMFGTGHSGATKYKSGLTCLLSLSNTCARTHACTHTHIHTTYLTLVLPELVHLRWKERERERERAGSDTQTAMNARQACIHFSWSHSHRQHAHALE